MRKVSCLLGTTGHRSFGLKIGTSVALDDAALVTGPKRIILSLGFWLLDNLYIATQAWRVGIGLRKLAIKSDGVVSWELGELAGNYGGGN